MKKQKEIDEKISHIVSMATIWSVGELYKHIKLLLQDEKKKWKEEVMGMIGEDEEKLSDPWTDERYAQDARNEFRQELRVKLKKL